MYGVCMCVCACVYVCVFVRVFIVVSGETAMATPVLRLMPLDKTGVTEQQQLSSQQQQQQQQQHEKSPEKSPTVKTDDTEFTRAIDQFTAAIELNRSNYTLYSNRSAALCVFLCIISCQKCCQQCYIIHSALRPTSIYTHY